MIMSQEGTNVIINKLIVMILKIPEIFQDLVDRTDTKATEMMTSLMIDLFTFYIIRDRRTFTTKFMLYRRQKLCLYLSDLKEWLCNKIDVILHLWSCEVILNIIFYTFYAILISSLSLSLSFTRFATEMLLKIFLLLIPTVFSIDNTRPRIDTKGQLMDVHDGNVIKYNNTYYWYGMGYTNCTLEKGVIPPYNCPGIYLKFGHCGFRTDHAINLYTSPDLESWTFVKNVFPESARPEGIYFRPKVSFKVSNFAASFQLVVNC